MVGRLRNRGPDARGIRTLRTAVLGHSRLAIIDPHEGRQPLANEDETVWLVCNGEIYNYKELRRELVSRGHRFRTQCDSEVIVHLYEEMGADCVTRLRGMFALAIWDEAHRSLMLARDPVGVKPLYYIHNGATLVFASTLTALMEHAAVGRELDLHSLHQYLTFHYIPSPGTILQDVFKLQPAERLISSDGRIKVQQYWNVAFEADPFLVDSDWMEVIRDGIARSVEYNLVSDVPVGAFVSGGLDSSAVVAAAADSGYAGLQTFTAGFHESRFDERAPARDLASRLGTRHREQEIFPNPLAVVDQLPESFDEPFADPSAIPTHLISKAAREHVKVVLSGDGGDELFAGYSRYIRRGHERWIRPWTAGRYTRSLVKTMAAAAGRRGRSAAAGLTENLEYAHYLDVAWFDPEETRALLNDEAASFLKDYSPFEVLRHHFKQCSSRDDLSRAQYVDFKTWLADGVLCKVDRASMAFGLEVRVPLLDTPFVQTMARLPRHLKIQGGTGKYGLRKAMEPALGSESVRRVKRGFEVPLDRWMAGPLHDCVHDIVLNSDSEISRWLDRRSVAVAWEQLQQGRRGMGARIWSFLMLEQWLKQNLISRRMTPVVDSGALATVGAD